MHIPESEIHKASTSLLGKDWVMKKMAIAFQTFKKNLNKDYIKKGLTPNFEKDFKNQCPYWDAFM